MSTAPTWDELDEKDRVRWLLERVMGYFILPDSACAYGRMEIPRGLEGFHWPIAYWDGGMLEVWMIRDIATDAHIFDPLRDFNDAWHVVRAINRPIEGKHDRYFAFIEQLKKIVGSDMLYDLFYCDPESEDQHLTPERICEAAFHAVEKP